MKHFSGEESNLLADFSKYIVVTLIQVKQRNIPKNRCWFTKVKTNTVFPIRSSEWSPLFWTEKRRTFFGGHQSFLCGHWYPCFGLLVTSALGFKAKVDPWLTYFLTYIQWIPQIHLWCDTCLPLVSQHCSRAFYIL